MKPDISYDLVLCYTLIMSYSTTDIHNTAGWETSPGMLPYVSKRLCTQVCQGQTISKLWSHSSNSSHLICINTTYVSSTLNWPHIHVDLANLSLPTCVNTTYRIQPRQYVDLSNSAPFLTYVNTINQSLILLWVQDYEICRFTYASHMCQHN